MIGENTLVRLRERSPTATWIVAVAFAALMVLASIPVGVGEYHNGAQNVGYLSAINWSVGFTVFTPLFLFFLLRALRSVDQMINRLAANEMIVDEDYHPLSNAADQVRTRWLTLLRRLGPIALAAITIAFLAVFLDWLRESGGPLLLDTEPDPQEIDWSVAHMDSPLRGAIALNAAFSFAAYLQQAVFAAALLLTAILAYAAVELIQSLVPQGAGPRLSPSAFSTDDRRGFQVFTTIPENLLLAVAFAYGQLYLGRVWNVYQRSNAESFQDFVIHDIRAGFTSGAGGVIPFVGGFLERPVNSAVGIIILIATAILGVIALMMVLFTLRIVARDARALFVEYLDRQPTGTYRGVPVAEVHARLSDMRLWPVRYPGPNQLLILAGVAAAVMFFYRLGFFYLGLLLLYVIKRARGLDEADAPADPPSPVDVREAAGRR